MKVVVKSDGTAIGTRVIDMHGNIVDGVRVVTWRHEAGGLPVAEVEMFFAGLETPCEARMIGPKGVEVRRIEYADGSVVEYPE